MTKFKEKKLYRLIMCLGILAVLGVNIVLGFTSAEAQPFAYVVNDGNPGSVSVIDTTTNNVVNTVTVGNSPNAIAITPDGTRAYVTNGGSDFVSVIDVATNTVVDQVVVGYTFRSVAITPDGKLVYVVSGAADKIAVIDTTSNTVVTSFEVLGSPYGIAITPDGLSAYVAITGYSGSVSVIDIPTNWPSDTIADPVFPVSIAITPDGLSAYVVDTNLSAPAVFVIDTATNEVIERIIDLNDRISSAAVTPDSWFVYVTSPSKVSVIETDTNIVVDTVTVGNNLSAIAITPDGARAYVVDRSAEGTVWVIDTTTNVVVDTVVVGLYPNSVAITPEPGEDSDGDGVPDYRDECPDSNLSPTVTIQSCDSMVPNQLGPDGCTISDLVLQCEEEAANHGQYCSCVSFVTDQLKKDGFLTGPEKGRINRCAAKADIP